MSVTFDGCEHEVADLPTFYLEILCRHREASIEEAHTTIAGYDKRIADLYESDADGNQRQIASTADDRVRLEGDCACWAQEIREMETELEIRKISRHLRKRVRI